MTNEILVLVEQRRGKIADITFEMLSKCSELGKQLGSDTAAVILGGEEALGFEAELKGWADKILLAKDSKFSNFNSEFYQHALVEILNLRKPILLMLGHTSQGMDLAPSLATQLELPLATDCIDLSFENGKLTALRKIYGGKINAKVSFKESDLYIATARPNAFRADKPSGKVSELQKLSLAIPEAIEYKKFVQYVEAAVGEIDITQSDIIVAVGRGIKEKENLTIIEELAQVLGGVIACSRPIVDKKWLPADRQVGTSGKTVKPKLYLAVGVSGAFQHVAGMSSAETIIAVNKDPNAPIFEVAHYGIVGDLFKVLPSLTKTIKSLRG